MGQVGDEPLFSGCPFFGGKNVLGRGANSVSGCPLLRVSIIGGVLLKTSFDRSVVSLYSFLSAADAAVAKALSTLFSADKDLREK